MIRLKQSRLVCRDIEMIFLICAIVITLKQVFMWPPHSPAADDQEFVFPQQPEFHLSRIGRNLKNF
jgi:hypothetical protein